MGAFGARILAVDLALAALERIGQRFRRPLVGRGRIPSVDRLVGARSWSGVASHDERAIRLQSGSQPVQYQTAEQTGGRSGKAGDDLTILPLQSYLPDAAPISA